MFRYEGYYVIYFLAVIVFICMAVLYSLTCRRIYFCRGLQRNINRDRQVLYIRLFRYVLLRQKLTFLVKTTFARGRHRQ